MGIPLTEILDAAVDIARQAGTTLLAGRADATDGLVTKQSAMDLTTATDAASERVIVELIRNRFPDDGVIGEEGGGHADGSTGRRWIIDPLDGTANFVHGWDASAVSIGVEVDGEPAVGVVFNPFRDELYAAATGHGAYRNGRRLRPRTDAPDLGTAFVGLTGAYDPGYRARRAEIARLLIHSAGDIRYTGSAALEFCYVADGRLDGFVANGLAPWDIAAGVVVAREAGCLVEGAVPGRPPERDLALAAVPGLMPALRAIVERADQAPAT